MGATVVGGGMPGGNFGYGSNDDGFRSFPGLYSFRMAWHRRGNPFNTFPGSVGTQFPWDQAQARTFFPPNTFGAAGLGFIESEGIFSVQNNTGATRIVTITHGNIAIATGAIPNDNVQYFMKHVLRKTCLAGTQNNMTLHAQLTLYDGSGQVLWAGGQGVPVVRVNSAIQPNYDDTITQMANVSISFVCDSGVAGLTINWYSQIAYHTVFQPATPIPGV